MALTQVIRGLHGNDTLARFLVRHRGVTLNTERPRLTVVQILRWADEYHRKTGRWPNLNSGPVAGLGTLTWRAVNKDLSRGLRGLPGASPWPGCWRSGAGRGTSPASPG
jgi:hypothetical protein